MQKVAREKMKGARKKIGAGNRKKKVKILANAHAPGYNVVHFCTQSWRNLFIW